MAFLHWRVSAEELRRLVPQQLQIDTFDGWGWIGVVPFTMSISDRSRLLTHRFHELNVRTYVIHNGKPGVYFFSLDATSSLAVEGARVFYSLPYYKAQIDMQRTKDGGTRYTLRRMDTRGPNATFIARYAATGPVFKAEPNSLEHFLTERYCLYAIKNGQVHRCDIHHSPWPLRPAEVEIEENSMCDGLQMELRGTPHVLFSQNIEVLTSGLVRSTYTST